MNSRAHGVCAFGGIERLESRRMLDGAAGPERLQIGDTLYYPYDDGVHGRELWKSNFDGSDASLVKDVWPGVYSSNPQSLFNYNGTLLFSATYIGNGGRELYRSDGTEAGTTRVADIYPFEIGSDPHGFFMLNGHALFFASDSGTDIDLYATDGTTAGTIRLFGKDGLSTYMQNLVVKDDLLFFDGYNASLNQYQQWQTDGTYDGTQLVVNARINNGQLIIIGTSGDDDIQIDSAGGVATVTINGNSLDFSSGDFTTIAITALGGNDAIHMGDGVSQNATIDGGEGIDTLDLSKLTQSMKTTGLLGSVINIGAAQSDSYSNVETLLCGSGDDTIRLFSYNGNNPIAYVDGGAGNDNINFYAAGYTGSVPTVHGGDGNDTLSVDREGGYHAENIPYSGGAAYYFGDAGDDKFVMLRSFANRDFNGGSGIDSVNYGNFSNVGGIRISLDDQPGDGPRGFDNVHSDVEIVYGTPFNDTIVGTEHNETLYGLNGSDLLIGNGGDDSLDGGSGNNTIIYGPPTVTPPAPQLPPMVTPPSPIKLNAGVLRVDGTDSADVIVLTHKIGDVSKLEVRFNGALSTFAIADIDSIVIDGRGGNDSIQIGLIGIPARLYGRTGNDILRGGDAADRIYGGEGDDWIAGGLGNDIIYGEAGNDRIFGGAGSDHLFGGTGIDMIRGEGGRDLISANPLHDDLRSNREDSIANDLLA